MDIRSDKEYLKTKQRVAFNNSGISAVRPDAEFREWLEKELGSVLFPHQPVMELESATVFLYNNPNLNKIHSISMDYSESLPFRPDMAFDSMWTTLEAMMMRYSADVWSKSGADVRSDWVHKEICDKVLTPTFHSEPELGQVFKALLDRLPYSVGRFALVRMLHDREIMYSSQFELVSKRASVILGKDLYGLFKARYLKDGNISGEDHYNGARKIMRMIRREQLTFYKNPVKNPTDETLYLFVISIILYTSRCERFHGDYFSPFVSSLTSKLHYLHWYWMLAVSNALFWIIFYQYTQRNRAEILKPSAIIDSIQRSIESLDNLSRVC